MRNELVLTIDFGDDREGVKRAFAHLIGVNPQELYEAVPGLTFSGTAIPNLFTLLRPANVKIQQVKDDR